MKIEHSDVSFFSSHKKSHEIKEQENLNIWNSEEDAPERLRREDRVELSNKLQKIEEEPFDIPLDSKLMSIIRALEALTGKKINLSLYRQEKPKMLGKCYYWFCDLIYGTWFFEKRCSRLRR